MGAGALLGGGRGGYFAGVKMSMLTTLLKNATIAAPLIFLGWYATLLLLQARKELRINRIFLAFSCALAGATASWLTLLMALLVFYPYLVNR